MKKLLLLIFLMTVSLGQSQTTYTWGGATGVWTTAASWTPARNTPATNDILILPTGTYTITGVITQTIGRLQVNTGANATLQTATAAKTLTMTGNASTELDIASGGNLFISVAGANNNTVPGLTLAFGAGSTATVAGRLEMTNNCGCGSPIVLNTTNCVMNVPGTLAAGGTLANSPWVTTPATLIITGTYEHKYTTTAGTFPSANWLTGATSTCAIIGQTTNTGAFSNFGQNFQNVTWNCPSQTSNLNIVASPPGTIAGTFNIANTNTGSLIMGGATINTKDFTQTGGTFQMNTAAGTSTLNVTGTFNQTGGTFQSSNLGTPLLSFNGAATQNVNFHNAAPTGSGLTYRINNPNGINLTGSGTLTTDFNINATGGVRVSAAGATPITTSLALVYAPGSLLTFDGGTNRTATNTVFPATNGPLFVSIPSGSSVNLNALNRTVSDLKLNGVSQVFSDYGGTGSGATTINPTYFTANPGILTVFCTTNTIDLSSAIGTDAQTITGGSAITTITYTTTGATGATFSGLPTGVTGNWLANVVTISGTPTTAGGTYTVNLTGGCGTISTTGTITVIAASYTWNAVNGAWGTAANWTPTRTTPFSSDILNFTDAAGVIQTVTAIPTQTIGRLNVSGAVTVLLQTTTSAKILTISSDGTATNELNVGVDSTLRINSTGFGITLAYTAGSTATIDGILEIINTTAANVYNFANCVTTVAAGGTFATGGTTTFGAISNHSAATFKVNGTYEHKWSGGALADIPSAAWNTGSTFLMSGSTSSATPFQGSNLGQTFYNFTWNAPGQTSAVNFGVMNIFNTTITNDFRIISTGSGSILYNNVQNYPTRYIKNYIQTGGTFNFSNGATASTLFITGNFEHSGGTITETSTGSGTFNFNGALPQTYTSGGTLANTINHTIANNAIVDFDTSVISSGSIGAFTLASGGKIITANANGLTASGASGTVQSSGARSYNSAAKYEFKGANTGDFALTTPNTITGSGNLILNNPSGAINVNQSITTPNLDLTNNVVTTGANTLSLTATGVLSRTTGYVNGNFNKFINTGSTATTFEIGDASNYTPVTLNYTGAISGATGSITASSTSGDHPQIATSDYNVNRTVNRFYTLTNNTVLPGLTSYSPDFTYVSADNDPTAVPANYVIRQYNGTWSAPSISGTPTNTSASTTGLTTFGDFAIGETKIIPTATISGTTTLCINEPNPLITFTAANGADVVKFRFFYTINGGSTQTLDTNAGQFVATLAVSTSSAKNDVYTLTRVEDLNTGIDQVQTGSATITVNLCTKIRPLQCGKTLPALNTTIQASPISGATEYTFEVTRVSNSFVTEVVSPNYYFYPASSIVGGLVYGEAYSIRVKVKVGGIYQLFGSACIVSAPNEPIVSTTQIRPFQCGATLSSIATLVQASPVYLATQYEFEVTSGAGTIIVPSNNYFFSLFYSVPGRALYSTPYSIRVRSKGAATAFTAWGATCIVTTPAAPMARVSDTNEMESIFNVKAFPNPFASHFSLDIESSSDAQVEMNVYDMIGRQLEVRKASVSELSVLEVGRNYPSGVYNVVVSQGDKVKSIRMIKR